MKTYKKTIESPRLVIKYDDYTESPREWSTLGYFITIDDRMHNPDRDTPETDTLIDIIKETGDIAESQEHHIELIKKEVESSLDDEVLAIYPVVKYEHSGVAYSLGAKHGFDYSNNGFYIITKKSREETGAKEENFEKIIENELENYNQYINGDIYQFILYDENGEMEDSCGGFYSIEDIREYLPKEWQDEDLEQYIEV